MRFLSELPDDRMWWSRQARHATAPDSPVASWWRVWPMRSFLLFEILRVAESASRRVKISEFRGKTLLSLKYPKTFTPNWRVRVAGFQWSIGKLLELKRR